jgi:hypothetical protein
MGGYTSRSIDNFNIPCGPQLKGLFKHFHEGPDRWTNTCAHVINPDQNVAGAEIQNIRLVSAAHHRAAMDTRAEQDPYIGNILYVVPLQQAAVALTEILLESHADGTAKHVVLNQDSRSRILCTINLIHPQSVDVCIYIIVRKLQTAAA